MTSDRAATVLWILGIVIGGAVGSLVMTVFLVPVLGATAGGLLGIAAIVICGFAGGRLVSDWTVDG